MPEGKKLNFVEKEKMYVSNASNQKIAKIINCRD